MILIRKRDDNIVRSMDLQVEIYPVVFEELSSGRKGESSAVIRERVIRARQIQEQRYAAEPVVHCNAQITSRLLERYARPDAAGLEHLRKAMDLFQMSARTYDRILKVARTIADLDGSETVAYIFRNMTVHFEG